MAERESAVSEERVGQVCVERQGYTSSADHSTGSDQILAAKVAAEHRRLFADTAALRSAALRYNFPHGFTLPLPGDITPKETDAVYGIKSSADFVSSATLPGDKNGSEAVRGEQPHRRFSGGVSESPLSTGSLDFDLTKQSTSDGSSQWTYEEQFKQVS